MGSWHLAIGKSKGTTRHLARALCIASVSEIIHNPGVKYPVLSTFCFGVLLFIACFYIGYYASIRLAYRHEQSQSFTALGVDEGRQFRREIEVLYALETSRIVTHVSQNTPDSLEKNISYLLKLRSQAPADLIPIVDLRIAIDHAVLSKLYETADKQADAAAHRGLAESIFRGLGWTDVSLNVVNAVADNQMRLRLAK